VEWELEAWVEWELEAWVEVILARLDWDPLEVSVQADWEAEV
jgi:hypothetical protein